MSQALETTDNQQERIRKEMERTNAQMRHFRGVAAGVLGDAQKLWEEIWESCQAPDAIMEILESGDDPQGRVPACGWQEFLEKLNLLGHYINYTKSLFEGSACKPTPEESEV